MSATVTDDSILKAPGRFSKALLGLFTKRATVAAIEDIGDCFRLVTLEGPALRGIAWTPGQKVQISMGSAFVNRTYTPMDWEAAAGRTRILGYLHGDGPGSTWLRNLRIDDECDVFGPRNSLDARRVAAPLHLLGDETSIALSHALASADWVNAVSSCFEVSDIDSVRQVSMTLGLESATLIAKRENDGHIGDMGATLDAPIAADASFVLTGKAATIQQLRQILKRRGVPAARVLAKAYWAPGKQGLD